MTKIPGGMMLTLFKQPYLQQLEERLAPQQFEQPIIEAEAQIDARVLDFNENAMGGLNEVQQLALQQLRAKYQDTLQIVGVDEVLQGIKGYLAQEYLKNPARVNDVPVPINAQRDVYNQVFDVQPPLRYPVANYDPNYINAVNLTENQKRALYQHKIYSALTVFQKPNYLIAPTAELTHVDNFGRPDSVDISEDSKELLALLWLALQDNDFAYDPDFNAETAKLVFINTLAGIARAHNLDNGPDDLLAYKPSCANGISSRLIKEYFQLVKLKTPLENPLDAALLRNLFLEELVAHNRKKTGIFDRIDKLNANGLKDLIAAIEGLYVMFEIEGFKDLSKNQQRLLCSIQWPNKTMDAFIAQCFERFSQERVVAQRNPKVRFQYHQFDNYGQLITHLLTNGHSIFATEILTKAQSRLELLERENNRPFGNLDLEPLKDALAPIDAPIQEGALALNVNHRAYIGRALSENEQLIINNLKRRYQASMDDLDDGITTALAQFKAHLVAEYRAKPAATRGAELNAAALLTDDFASIHQHFERRAGGRIYLKANQAILDDEIIANERNPGQFVFVQTSRDTREVRLFNAALVPVNDHVLDITINPMHLNDAQQTAILNHPAHSALRYLFHVNSPLLSRHAGFTARDHLGNKSSDIYPQARELIAFLWVALNDPGYQLKDNLTHKQGLDFLVRCLHNTNRTYSDDNDFDKLDNPSCPAGGLGRLVRECFIAIRELEPQERALDENTFLNKFKSLLIANNDKNTGLFNAIEQLPLATLRAVFSALESLYVNLTVDSFAELEQSQKKALQQLAWSNATLVGAMNELFTYFSQERILAKRQQQLRFQNQRFDNYGQLFVHLCENAIGQFSAELYNKADAEITRKEAAEPQPPILNMQRLNLNPNPPRPKKFIFAPPIGGPRI